MYLVPVSVTHCLQQTPMNVSSRNRFLWQSQLTLLLCPFLLMTSCQKPAAKAPTAESPKQELVPATVPTEEPEVPRLDPLIRAGKLGFAQRLSADTESLMWLKKGKEWKKSFQSTSVWQMIVEKAPHLATEESPDPQSSTASVWDFVGEEFFVATGAGTALQSDHLLTLANRINYFQMRASVRQLIQKKPAEQVDQMEWVKELARDPESGSNWLKQAEMPPVLLGFKTTETNREKVNAALTQLSAGLATAGDAASPVELTRAGASFSGTQISGKKLVDMLSAESSSLESLDQSIGAQALKDLLAAMKDKNILVLSGELDGYALLFIGSRVEDFQFADSPATSLAASTAFRFADAYVDQSQLAVIYGKDTLLKSFSKSSGLAVMARALRDGVAGNNQSDTRELEGLLDLLVEKEVALLGMMDETTLGAVIYLDQGLRLESFGGQGSPSLRVTQPLTLGALGESPDVAIFANWSSDEAQQRAAFAYLESMGDALYGLARQTEKMDLSGQPEFAPFKKALDAYNQHFRDASPQLWEALSKDFSEGIGAEGAMVVDFLGEMPPLPKVPQELVNEGKFVRVSLVNPVRDRAKLESAWKKINASGEQVMKGVSALIGQQQAMPKPMSAKSDQAITWFIPGPLFTDDFLPSVTLSDQWFVASSSKNQAVALAQAAGKSKQGKTGAFVQVRFKCFASALNHWIQSVSQHEAVVFKGLEARQKEFQENLPMLKRLSQVFESYETLTIHSRTVRGELRSSLWLKAK